MARLECNLKSLSLSLRKSVPLFHEVLGRGQRHWIHTTEFWELLKRVQAVDVEQLHIFPKWDLGSCLHCFIWDVSSQEFRHKMVKRRQCTQRWWADLCFVHLERAWWSQGNFKQSNVSVITQSKKQNSTNPVKALCVSYSDFISFSPRDDQCPEFGVSLPWNSQ